MGSEALLTPGIHKAGLEATWQDALEGMMLPLATHSTSPSETLGSLIPLGQPKAAFFTRLTTTLSLTSMFCAINV